MKLFISLLLLGLSLSACATGPFANLNDVNRPNFVGQFLGKWHGQDNSSLQKVLMEHGVPFLYSPMMVQMLTPRLNQ